MKKISEAELEVMNVIWRKKEVTSSEIIKELDFKKWNPNTIRTLIKRLHTKGAIEIIKIKGKRYIYKTSINEKEYKATIFRKILKKLYHNSINEFVEQCYESEILSLDTLKRLGEELRDLIKNNE